MGLPLTILLDAVFLFSAIAGVFFLGWFCVSISTVGILVVSVVVCVVFVKVGYGGCGGNCCYCIVAQVQKSRIAGALLVVVSWCSIVCSGNWSAMGAVGNGYSLCGAVREVGGEGVAFA